MFLLIKQKKKKGKGTNFPFRRCREETTFRQKKTKTNKYFNIQKYVRAQGKATGCENEPGVLLPTDQSQPDKLPGDADRLANKTQVQVGFFS